MKTKPGQNNNIHMIRKSLQRHNSFLFLIAAPHTRQKLFSKISSEVLHNPLHLQSSVQSTSLLLQ